MEIVITKEDLIQLIEECFKEECKCKQLECLEMVAKVILKAVENTRKKECKRVQEQ